MPPLFFADNSVLVNFGFLQRMDLLEQVLRGHGTWCHGVSVECDRWSTKEGYSSLSQAWAFLGRPHEPTRSERLDTLVLQRELAEMKDGRVGPDWVPDGRDYGEAETLAIIGRRFRDAVFITDDRRAALRAAGSVDQRLERIPVRIITTCHLLRMAVRTPLPLDRDESWTCIQDLVRENHGVPYELKSEKGWFTFVDGNGVLNDWP